MVKKPGSPTPASPIVVKLGGSLQAQVPELVPVFLASGRPLLIIPGGGIFADAVRKLPVDDNSAHWMAIAAMDQYGWFIASQGMRVSDHLQEPDGPVVFLPYRSMRQHDPLPHTWDITSDSIAAWVADFLGLDILLLKPVEGITQEGVLLEQISAPVETDVVDPFFISFVLEKKVTTTILNGSYPDRLEKFLRGRGC
jgi:5-(aminomethyl)-3-furanmethanol phosphate kinase